MAFLISTNPSRNYEEVGKVAISTKADVSKAVALAQEAFPLWQKLGVHGRIPYLKQIQKALFSHKEVLAASVSKEMGMPITSAREDIEDALKTYLQWYLSHAEMLLAPEVTQSDDVSVSTVYYEPVGAVGVITPWNFPVSNWVWGCIAHLIAGNTVIYKCSEECPITGKLIADIIAQTDLPKGVFSEIYGDGKVGRFLLDEDITMISFTGSSKVGKLIYQKAAEKGIKALLELGGSAPGIICEDVSIEDIIPIVFMQRFFNNGQVCDGMKRLMVHEQIFEDVVEQLVVYAKTQIIGDALDEKTHLGPLVAKRQLEVLEAQLADAQSKGATILGGGKPDHLNGAYYLPTIVTNITPEMKIWHEEVFGPVLPVLPFSSDEEVIRMANHTDYGLGGYIFAHDIPRAEHIARAIRTGMVSINGANYVQPCNPFGGCKQSGVGREHGRYGLYEVCDIKVITKPAEIV